MFHNCADSELNFSFGREDGTNQGVKHFADYWEKYPERIPSLEQRLGVNAGDFNNSLEGFENFTKQTERVIDEATVNGNVRNINGKLIYYNRWCC